MMKPSPKRLMQLAVSPGCVVCLAMAEQAEQAEVGDMAVARTKHPLT